MRSGFLKCDDQALERTTLPNGRPLSSTTGSASAPGSRMHRERLAQRARPSGTLRVPGSASSQQARATSEHGREGEPLERPLVAHEAGDEVVGRVREHPLGRVALHEAALAHDRDPVAEPHGLVDVVRDEHDRLAQPLLDAEELPLQPLARQRVDRAERLVHQQHRRVGRQRAGHADALRLAAGQLVGVGAAVALGIEPDELEQLAHAGVDPRPCPSRAARARVPMFSCTVQCGNRPTPWIA